MYRTELAIDKIKISLIFELQTENGKRLETPQLYESPIFLHSRARLFTLKRSYHCPIKGEIWARTWPTAAQEEDIAILNSHTFHTYNRSDTRDYLGQKGSFLIDTEDIYILPFPLLLREWDLRVTADPFSDAIF